MADGQASGTFVVLVHGDTAAEPDESFTVSIRAPLGYAPGTTMSATGTILNDDVGTGPVWSGAVNGNTGYISTGWNPSMRTWDATARQLVFTRATNVAGGNHRTLFALSGLTVGRTYSMPITGQIVGSGPSAGVTMGVSTDSTNGGGQTSIATMSAAYANGTTPHAFTATAETMYFVLVQGPASGSDNVFRLSELGPLT